MQAIYQYEYLTGIKMTVHIVFGLNILFVSTKGLGMAKLRRKPSPFSIFEACWFTMETIEVVLVFLLSQFFVSSSSPCSQCGVPSHTSLGGIYFSSAQRNHDSGHVSVSVKGNKAHIQNNILGSEDIHVSPTTDSFMDETAEGNQLIHQSKSLWIIYSSLLWEVCVCMHVLTKACMFVVTQYISLWTAAFIQVIRDGQADVTACMVG